MESQPHNRPTLELLVDPGTVPLFATVLQGGIAIQSRSGETLGAFLAKLPEFSKDYIINDIQTIFLNGTAIDDLETPLEGDNQVLALSAAMPGLAGAIFRKNSFHAALRTTFKEKPAVQQDHKIISITLKLFNSIARDRGPALLATGVSINATNLLAFFKTSPALLGHISHIDLDGKEGGQKELAGCLEQNRPLNLTVREACHD